MSAAAKAGEGQGSCAAVTARFKLRAGEGQDVAGAAAELLHRLQEMANLPQCAYELDVDVEWPSAGAGAPSAEHVGARLPGSPPSSPR